MISTLLDRLFQRTNVPSGAQVKHRLKFILAHDRAAIEPQVFANMREEIMRVVSKYVELDEATLDIRLESDKRMTALIANLPIRMVREDLPDLQALFDETPDKSNNIDQPDALVIEMDLSAEAALDAIMAKETTKSPTEDISPESIAVIAERTTEVTNKIRTAATKSQNGEDRTVVESDSKEQKVIADSSTSKPINANNELDSSINDKDEELNNQSSDQLELSLDVSSSLASKEVVVEETPELYNQS